MQHFALPYQFFRGPLLLRDVARYREHVRLALIEHWNAMDFHLQRGSVFALIGHLGVERLSLGYRGQDLVQRGPTRLPNRLRGVACQKLLIAVAVHPPQREIDVDDRAVWSPEGESVDGCVEDRSILLRAVSNDLQRIYRRTRPL